MLDIIAYIIIALTVIFVALPIIGAIASIEEDYIPCMKCGAFIVGLIGIIGAIIWAFNRVL